MTKYHIAMELNVDVDDSTPDAMSYLTEKFTTATGFAFAWVNPELGSNEPYKAFRTYTSEAGVEVTMLVGTLHVRPIDRWFKTDAHKLLDVSNVIQKIASERRWHLGSNYLPDQITALVDHAGREGDSAVREMKSLLDNLISHLRGMEIVVDMVGNASTHSEKNARLRGLAEVIQTAIKRATEFSYDFSWKHWNTYNDLFKSDFPMRDVTRLLHEKEAEIERLKRALGEIKAPTDDADSIKGDQIVDVMDAF